MTSNATQIYSYKIQFLIDETIMSNKDNHFDPTYLYIKQHSITNLSYFGKTTLNHDEMLKYKGSGTYWTDHITVHGIKYVDTIWYCLFLDLQSLVEFAITFSHINNIGYGDTSSWANLIPENGLSGAPKGNKGTFTGKTHSNKTKALMSLSGKGKPKSEEHRQAMRRPKTPEHIANLTGANNGMWGKSNPPKIVTCPYCNITGSKAPMTRWHFDNCKSKSH